mgnify:CR=1 FL=1
MTPHIAISIYKMVEEVSGRVICLLKDEDIPDTTIIMLCEYMIALVRAEEALFLYLNSALLTTQENTKDLEERVRKDIFFAAEIEAEIKQKTNLSFEVH